MKICNICVLEIDFLQGVVFQLCIIIQNYFNVFKLGFGIVKGIIVKLELEFDVCFKFCKVCFVFYVFQEVVEVEYNCFELEGIVEWVEFSEWVILMVYVFKVDGIICFCGDYVVIVNFQFYVFQYLIFFLEDVFLKLWGG